MEKYHNLRGPPRMIKYIIYLRSRAYFFPPTFLLYLQSEFPSASPMIFVHCSRRCRSVRIGMPKKSKNKFKFDTESNTRYDGPAQQQHGVYSKYYILRVKGQSKTHLERIMQCFPGTVTPRRSSHRVRGPPRATFFFSSPPPPPPGGAFVEKYYSCFVISPLLVIVYGDIIIHIS